MFVGIDLGTSTSEIAYIKGSKPVVIENELDEKITLSVVSVGKNDEMIVGADAKARALLYPDDTVMEVKRLMGTDKKIKLKNSEYTPEEISAEILKHLKKNAEKKLNEKIEKAVITVPAYFTDRQRQATKKAADLANIEVGRIINEPTAAALTYGIENMDSEQNILIYDLGGGTFDVTLLEMFDGILDVKASSGNNSLGGKDFDKKIIDELLNRFEKKNNIDLSSNISSMIKIKSEAEKCKIALSKKESYTVSIPFVSQKNEVPIEMHETITRKEFEDMISDLVKGTSDSIDVVLKDSKMKKEEIDLILLVGGSTKIPFVKEFIKEYLNQAPKELIDPDLAVSKGAAIQAGILQEVFDVDKDILITDVSPYALGVEIAIDMFGSLQGDVMDILIERNTTIPVTKEKIYTTSYDNQQEVKIKVYQGDKKIASLNNFIDEFILSGVPKGPEGEEKIKVKFSYDANGMLDVEGIIMSTGKSAQISINILDVKDKKINIQDWKEAPRAKEFRAIIRKIDRVLKKDNNEKLKVLQEDLKIALIKEKDYLIEQLEDEILNLLEEI